MQAAFGPYTDNQLHPMEEHDREIDWQDKVVLAGSIICAIAVALILWTRV